MKTILVIGANGFIGTHTIKFLQGQSNVEIIAACRDKSRLHSSFSGKVREGDLRDDAYLETLLDGVDVVVDAMAWSSLWGQKDQSEQLFYKPTVRLIDCFLKSDASRFVNISTTAAAAPEHSSDAMAEGIMRPFWPHMCNNVRIENYLRANVSCEKSVINLRLGIFVGEHYGLGVLPILLPRLKTHLVPWVAGGKTQLALADGRDYGQAMGRAALKEGFEGFHSFNVVGKEIPTVREVILFLHNEFGVPKPHFSVPFWIAYQFAWLMEKIDPLVPWEPLIVRSIIHLMENTGATNERATQELGYLPEYDWRDAVRRQVAEMNIRQKKPMGMVKAVS